MGSLEKQKAVHRAPNLTKKPLPIDLFKSNKQIFGINLKIKHTDGKAMMESELHDFIETYLSDLAEAAAQQFVNHKDINPLDWTPFNLKWEKWQKLN